MNDKLIKSVLSAFRPLPSDDKPSDKRRILLVVAASHKRFEHYCRKHNIAPYPHGSAYYVDRADRILGLNPEGVECVIVGTPADWDNYNRIMDVLKERHIPYRWED